MQSDKHINNLKEVKVNPNPKGDEPLSEKTITDNESETLALHLITDTHNIKPLPSLSEGEQIDMNSQNDFSNQFKCNICGTYEAESRKSLRNHKQMVHGIISNSNSSITVTGQSSASNGLKTTAKPIKLEANSSGKRF